MLTLHQSFFYYLGFINILTFLIYGYDKFQAKRGGWRVSEKVLLVLAAAWGSLGALLAIYFFRHKTQHKKFIYGVRILIMLQVAVYCLFYLKY